VGLYSYNPVARTGQQNNLLTLVYTEIDNAWLLVRKQKLSYSGPYPEKNFEGVLGTRRRRRRGRVAAGDEIETPKASRGVWNGEGVSPSPADYKGVWGSVVSSPSGVRGGAPAENGFDALYSCQKAPRSNHFEYFEVHVLH